MMWWRTGGVPAGSSARLGRWPSMTLTLICTSSASVQEITIKENNKKKKRTLESYKSSRAPLTRERIGLHENLPDEDSKAVDVTLVCHVQVDVSPLLRWDMSHCPAWDVPRQSTDFSLPLAQAKICQLQSKVKEILRTVVKFLKWIMMKHLKKV